ncbi:MAG: hypothetical protein COV67_01280 [Nitrospinae bacterium CG11_big_fil_rev_8_21_14_0_20_56_8]|nr:MAG: hypothetical protein COV67_01280 [Nitrospinae bacterium CG11_big_fil_rev_8_21_14_0_20_56_8]
MQFDKEAQVRILRVAGDRLDGKPVSEIDDRIGYVMDLHPEFEEIWKLGELAIYPQEIDGKVVNPFVHTVFHVIVDKQINDADPWFVPVAFDRLKEQGLAEHDSLHAIISVYADLYFANFRKGKQFDFLDYQSRLDRLEFVAEG